MAKLRAFIARSFHEEDNKRLRPILEFLDTFQKAGFFCESAEPAEVELVSKKVRRIIGECDVLIGFFTRKHAVYEIGSTWLNRLAIVPGIQPLLWTAPAWVLQESGYALGRDKDVILLREEGVETPGLQGDLEYVPFDPENPSTVFGKLSSMINDLLAAADGRKVEITVTESPAELSSEPATVSTPEKASAPTTSEYSHIVECFIELFTAGDQKDFSTMSETYDRGLEVIDRGESGTIDRVSWTSTYLGTRYKAGDPDALDSLRKLHEENPTRPEPLHEIANQFHQAKEFKQAAAFYQQAAALYDDHDIRFSTLLQLAQTQIETKEYDAAARTAETVLSAASGSHRTEATTTLYKALWSKEEKYFAFAVAEAALTENPQHPIRFELGRNYIGSDLDELAFLHFTFLHQRDEADYASAHNLALACSECSLPIASIANYKLAIQNGGSLAAANLAYKYLDAGMAKEAKDVIDEAIKNPERNEQIAKCLADIEHRSSEESSKQAVLLEEASEMRGFFNRMGKALARPQMNMEGRWRFPFGEITLGQAGASVSGTAQITSEKNSLALLLLGKPGEKPTKTERYTLKGTLHGAVLKFELTVEEPGASAMLGVLSGSSSISGFVVIGKDEAAGEYVELEKSKLGKRKIVVRTSRLIEGKASALADPAIQEVEPPSLGSRP